MSQYFIRWKSKVTGVAGKGKLTFEKEKADEMCREMNFDFPEIFHEAVLAVDSSTENSPAKECEQNPKDDGASERTKTSGARTGRPI